MWKKQKKLILNFFHTSAVANSLKKGETNMTTEDEVKKNVKEKYGEIAEQSDNSCCSLDPSCCSPSDIVGYTVLNNSYENLEGYIPEADLGLGCGLPTEFADIKEGDTVVDLGSGAGNDVFIARSITGEKGKVIGIDMTEEMVDLSNKNNNKLGYDNVEFHLGEIEALPLDNEIADIVVSNCVLNLVPNKEKAFSEIYRVLRPGAHFCISDIVLKGDLPDKLRKSAEMYVGCVAGALQQDEYLNTIKNVGFHDIQIKQTKTIDLPDEVLIQYLPVDEINDFRKNKVGIFSITVVGYK